MDGKLKEVLTNLGEELTYSEDVKVVVNKVLRDDELRRVREFWEYLRRSPDYRTDYNKLSNPYATISGEEDRDADVRFCQKWKIQFPLNPRLSFDQIIYLFTRYENLPLALRFRQPLPDDTWEKLRAPERIREVLGFVFDFEPAYSDAAFVDSEDEIVDSVYLNVWIDLKWPEECILTSKGEKGELKKILDAWFPERRSRWAPTSEGPAVVVGEKNGSIVQLLLNCTASKSKILSAVKPKISELHSGWDGQREDKQKLYDDVLRLRLLVYDMIEGFMREQVTATEVGTLLNLPTSTINRKA